MLVHNKEIADSFEQLADLLEVDEANPFRVRAYRNAARTINGELDGFRVLKGIEGHP